MRRAALRIGLTGGIGSGKSTIAAILVAHGATLVDADAISRAVTAAGGSAMAEIAALFGDGMVTPEGAMHRDRMRQLVFDDPSSRRKLESIVHPWVSRETLWQYEQAVAGGSACVIFDVPLLVESGRWRQQLDQVLVVDCAEATQIDRVTVRNGWPRDVVEKIMAGQASRAQRLAAADVCLYNDGLTLADLEGQVRQLAARFGL
ncbi:dephospho-CoA kinase [Polaromonas sp.]|uniref:dephospho-CoA kinase n=1 Tax=Polaromonas sp. TaxID=1869339 RepID=UPI003266994B